MPTGTEGADAAPRSHMLIVALSAIGALAPLAINMYLPALPTMAAGLGGTIDQMEATVAVFLLGYAFSQLVFGPLSDRFGRRKVLLGGLCLFAAASIMCSLARTPNELYLFRFLQAFGGGASVTIFALVKDRYDTTESAQVISYIMALIVIAPLIAPILGGYLLVGFGWRAIFIMLFAFALAALALTYFFVEGRPQLERSQGSGGGEHPLQAYKTVLSDRVAMLQMLVGAFSFAVMFAFVAGSPFVYIEYFGVAPDNYGYLVGVNAAAMIVANLVNTRLIGDMAPTRKVIGAVYGLIVASLWLVIANSLGGGLIPIMVGVVLFVGMLGLISANAIAGALAGFDEEAGTASALMGVLQFGLGAFSSAIISGWAAVDATPLVTVMAGCGLLAFVCALPLTRRATQK